MDNQPAATFLSGEEAKEEEEEDDGVVLDEESVDCPDELVELREKTKAVSLDDDLVVSVTRNSQRDMRFGLVEQPVIHNFKYDEERFPGISESKFIRDFEINASKIVLCYKRTDTDWDELYTPITDPTALEGVEADCFSYVDDPMTYIRWNGWDIRTNTVLTQPVEVMDDKTFRDALEELLSAIETSADPNSPHIMHIRFVIAFLLKLSEDNKNNSALGWVVTAILAFQVVLNQLPSSRVFALPYGIEFDKRMDNRYVLTVHGLEGNKVYKYTVAHYLFELICKWAIGFRVPGILLRPSVCVEKRNVTTSPELYLRQRGKQFDKDYVDCALESVFEYIMNVRYDNII